MITRLAEAEDNGAAIQAALANVIAVDEQAALTFLIENLQAIELQRVEAAKLIEEVQLACQARREMPWGSSIPDELFYNDVLPWFNVDEPREHWRSMLFEKCRELVADCKTPGEAAQQLNRTLFTELSVKYSTKRKRANQAPSESIEQGLASCTGLSILLSDACRSVCVPARLAGIPSWTNKRGNHTWVEVWDDGQWYFTGAAEPSDKGLDHGWFKKDAALADKDSRMNSIYAMSFQPTDTEFPVVWSRGSGVKTYAINVTERYTGDQEEEEAAEIVQTRFRIWNHDRTERVETQVVVENAYLPAGEETPEPLSGMSTGNTADMNNMLEFELLPASPFRVSVTSEDVTTVFPVRTGTKKTQLVELNLPQPQADGLDEAQQKELETAIQTFFEQEPEVRGEFDERFNEMLKTNPDSVREIVRRQWMSSPTAMKFKEDFEKDQVTFEEHLSPYKVKEVGDRPAGGWPLVIAMHGGGGAPKRVNDQQWNQMQRYYREHPEIGGYKYLALRAPNDTWNGFYDKYVYPLIENLVQQMVAHGDIDPDHVMLIGYSHGGYGAFAIGPKIPYRFSAIHASASAPTDGQIGGRNLRNTRFTFMVGENDTRHGRKNRCDRFAEDIKAIQATTSDCTEFPVQYLYQPGFGHGGLPDRDILPNLYVFQRNVTPQKLSWHQTDPVVKRHFWLEDSRPERGKLIEAEIVNDRVTVKVTTVGEANVESTPESVSFLLDHRLVNVQNIAVVFDGAESKIELQPSLKTLCETMEQTGDISLSYGYRFSGKQSN